MITFDELKEKSKFIESKYNLNHFEVLQRFMFERILERIHLQWNNYALKNSYANGIEFINIINVLEEFLGNMEFNYENI